MVEEISSCYLDFHFCEHCVYGKQNQVKFLIGSIRIKMILQLIHSDVFGFVIIPSLGKYLYYVSFIDDFSRNTWKYFPQQEYEVFRKFKEFKDLVRIIHKRR